MKRCLALSCCLIVATYRTTPAASLSGTWFMRGPDATDIVGPSLGWIDAVETFTTFVDETRSGPHGYTSLLQGRFIATGGFATQRVRAAATNYGDLRAFASSRSDKPTGMEVNQFYAVNAGVVIRSTDTFQYLFLPTANKPVPETLTLKFALDGNLAIQANPTGLPFNRFLERANIRASARGPRAYYIDPATHQPSPYGWDAQVGAEVVAGSFYGGLGSTQPHLELTLYVDPDYSPPAISGTPFLVSYSFTLELLANAESGQNEALADVFNTLTFKSILFPDGTTPESQGMALVFDSGIASPNLRGVPEPRGMALALATISGGVWHRRRRTVRRQVRSASSAAMASGEFRGFSRGAV